MIEHYAVVCTLKIIFLSLPSFIAYLRLVILWLKPFFSANAGSSFDWVELS